MGIHDASFPPTKEAVMWKNIITGAVMLMLTEYENIMWWIWIS